MWKEFKPTILFLAKFFGIYFLFSMLYGFYISSYDTSDPPQTDPITKYIAVNCGKAASILGYQFRIVEDDHVNAVNKFEVTYDSIWLDNNYAISIEEGCNGINIMILFVAFVVAFGGKWLSMLLFIPSGLLFIHISNIARLMLLSLLNVEWGGEAFHFFHKYGFTAVIYLSVFLLWYLWVVKFSGKQGMSLKKKA
ncbi:exosortase family protein XrtF [Owenweeksia hongkongensis]|uniref:exosortase family protein XrtF n=1 Tax=Owenweeksia hongkongensis TaxID=253245 RepID=UPI003A8F17AD